MCCGRFESTDQNAGWRDRIARKGTPQGGIISPLLANIVLNELDHWIDSQWLEHPVLSEYKLPVNKMATQFAAMDMPQCENSIERNVHCPICR